MPLPARSARGMWLAGLCWGLACGRSGEVLTEPLELARGPVQRAEPAPVPVPDAPPAAAAPDVPVASVEEDPRREVVVAWLERECSGCHAGAEEGGWNNIDALLSTGLLQAGAAEVSPLVLWLQYGSSRREHGGIRVSPEEFDTLVGYVNAVPALMTCAGFDIVDRDRAYEIMALDISTRAAADRPFIRYVGFARANPSGGCSVRFDRSAFVELLNGVSLGPTIVPPAQPSSSEPTGAPVYALDIRDYGWATPIDVGGPEGRHFEDRWSAIVDAVGPEAFEVAGPEADLIKRETQTPIPFLTAAQFVAAAAVGELYSALVGVGNNVTPLFESLGVDDASLWRAGVFGAGSVPDRVVTRREQRAFPGHSWWTREELPTAGGSGGLGADPVRFPNEGGEVIFTLPNGLFAFALVDSDGGSAGAIPSCIGGLPCPTVLRAENSITCRACHGGGVVSVTDEVLPYLDAEPGRYSAELEPLIREQYRPDLWQALEADMGMHDRAAEAAGSGLGNAVARLYFEHTRRPLDALHVADELGVSIDQLRSGVDALGSQAAALAPLLSEGTIEREQLSMYRVPLGCSIAGLRNVPARCP